MCELHTASYKSRRQEGGGGGGERVKKDSECEGVTKERWESVEGGGAGVPAVHPGWG